MEYLNQFHKESSERSMKATADYQKSPMPSKEAAKKAFEMHKKLENKSLDRTNEN